MVYWLIALVLLSAQQTAPNLILNKIGFADGATVEWVISLSNTGGTADRNVILTDQLPPALTIDSVTANLGEANIDGQTVTVAIPTLESGATVQVSIITQAAQPGSVENTVCVVSASTDDTCISALAVSALPATGHTPYWRNYVLLAVLCSLVVIGVFVFKRRLLPRDVPPPRTLG
jgi:uncharacterized repeat protein (TIGR01451 family)